MARNQKSFFSRIIGGDITEQPSSADGFAGAEYIEEDMDILDEDIAAVADELPEINPVSVSEQINQQPLDPNAATEDWVADYEGSLNIDMYQTKDNIILKSTIAGVSPNDLDITVAGDMVTVSGSRVREEQIPDQDYFYQECYWGPFSRSVLVPVDIDSEQIEADLKDGILTVIIPKAAKSKTKKIMVRGL